MLAPFSDCRARKASYLSGETCRTAALFATPNVALPVFDRLNMMMLEDSFHWPRHLLKITSRHSPLLEITLPHTDLRDLTKLP